MPFINQQYDMDTPKLPSSEVRPAVPGGLSSEVVSSYPIILDLSDEDAEVYEQIRRVLSEHLGSEVAAIAWLNSSETGYPGTALDVIRQGHAALVLKDIENQWGPCPPYA